MMNSVIVKEYTDIELNRKEVLRYAGVRGDVRDFDAHIDECIAEAINKLRYSVCYREFPVSIEGDCIDLGFTKVVSRDLKKNLHDCERILLFAATLGIELDRLITKYGKLSPAKALLFQSLGAERIESLCDTFCRDFQLEVERHGMTLCPRFSTGYGDLPLELQEKICDTLETAKKIGVCVNKSLLMSPAKSVTAIVGIKKK